VQIIIDPTGRVILVHRKVSLADEQGYVQAGTSHDVAEVKGLKVGIAICADGSFKTNLDALVKNGARLIYGPHATGSTPADFYNFRALWGGPGGWMAQLSVHAALHSQAALYNPTFDPPAGPDANTGWSSGAWFIGPSGQTLAQMPTSGNMADSKEYILTCDIPIPRARGALDFARESRCITGDSRATFTTFGRTVPGVARFLLQVQ
jgi:predicted amidohydrolase